MAGQSFYPTPIEIKGLSRNSINRRTLDEGKEVVVVFSGDEIRVLADQCPHMGAPLSEGILGKDGTLQCPWHGYIYDLKTCEMKCNPNDKPFEKILNLYKSFKPEKKPKYRLPALSHEVREGKIYVRKGGGE